MSLTTAIAGLRTAVATVTGLTRVYDDPPESISEFPCAMVYVESGVYTDTPAGGYGMHTLIVDIYESRTVLPQAVNNAKQWPDKLRTVILTDRTLGGTVSHIGDAVQFFSYRALPLPYNDNVHYGMRFRVPVKVNYT